MSNALKKKDDDEVKDVAEASRSREERVEQISRLLAKLRGQNQVDKIGLLAEQFHTGDGAGEALGLVTAAPAGTATKASSTQSNKIARKRLKSVGDGSQA